MVALDQPAAPGRLRLACLRRQTPFSILLWVLLGAIAFAVIYPLIVAIVREFDAIVEGWQAITGGELRNTVPGVLRNTAIVVAGATCLALVIGSSLAWANERSDASLGFAGQLLPLSALIVPPVAGVIGWAVLLDPRVGLMNYVIRVPLGWVGLDLRQGPFDIYTMSGLVVVTGLYTVPYVYLVISAALQRLDPSVEEASRISGAGPFATMFRVTLPAVMPALAASVLLGVISGVSLFSVPAVLGGGARIEVLSVFIFRLLAEYPAQTGPALVLALVMLVFVQLLLVGQSLLVRGGRNAAMSGKGFRVTPVRLGRLRPVIRGVAGLYLIFTAVLPLLGLVLVSLQPFWTPQIDPSAFTFENFRNVLFENRYTVSGLINSLTLGLGVATVNMLVTGAAMLHFSRSPGSRRFADALTGIPATIPHTVIGVAFILAFSAAPLKLYGTTWILFIAFLVMTLPYAGRAAASAAASIAQELGESSRVNGASDARTLFHILLPLAMPGLVA
ncbi:MAG: ABC transporter permease, partial [Qingshengfaniella sp.]